MGWFDEQIKERLKNDDDAFSEAFAQMAGVVMGPSSISKMMKDQMKQSQTAMEEILRYFHIKPKEITEKYRDMEDMMEMQLRPHGIMYRTVTLKKGWYKDGMGILLGSTKSGDVIALIPKGTGGYRYLDRRTGKYHKVTKTTEGEINPEAICFYNPLPLKAVGMKELLTYLMRIPSVSDIRAIAVITLLIALLGLFTPKVNSLIFSKIVITDDKVLLLASLILLAGVTISSTLIGAIKTILMDRIQTKMNISIESATMMRVLSLPSSFFKKYSAGNIGSRMKAISSLCTLLGDAVLSTGITSLFSLIYIGQIFQYAPNLVVPALCITFLSLAVSVITALVQTRIGRQTMQHTAKEQGLVYSMFSGVQKIKLAGAEKRFFARWAKQYVKTAQLTYSPPAIIKYHAVFTIAIGLFGTVALYAAAVGSGVSVSDYMAFNVSYAMITGAFSALSSVAITAANIKPIMAVTRPIMETLPEIAQNKKTPDRLSGGIELNHVSFRYSETMPPVIEDLSLKIRPGQYVAIVGATGCGKSTLMRLMLGFETPQKGAVYYDGRDLDTLDLKSLRQKIGVVLQNGKLFQGDIFSNIVISNPRLTMDDAWEAAEMSGMAQDISNMPMGMHTMISEGAGGISGGQRQRLMIARAIAPKPKILMFDEATSALDNITQKIVSQSLNRLKCTRIVIAHRLSTIRQCDRIVVLDRGKIIEDGTYDQLVAQKGFFSDLVARQQPEHESSSNEKGRDGSC